jgi:tetratricopeptide (TPR) repeat protein
MANSEAEITQELSDALIWVLGAVPTDVSAVVVVAACLDRLAKGYGLSESGQNDLDPLEEADLPDPAEALLGQLFGGPTGSLTADDLRDGLYGALVQLADDRDARKMLNANKPLTDRGLLYVGQIYWNLESRGTRTRLPIQPGPINSGNGPGAKQIHADIPVPKANQDFATTIWINRCNQSGTYKSAGGSFRKQGARLAVLAAQRLVAASYQPLPDLEGAVLRRASDDESRVTAITWPVEEPTSAPPTLPPPTEAADVVVAPLHEASPGSVGDQPVDLSSQRVLVGSPASVGTDYQRRGFDTELEQLWNDGGERRIWLRGGPGLGKSYTARRVMEQALSDQGPDHEVLLIWVDSADRDSVSAAFAAAIDRLGQLGVIGRAASNAPDAHRAKALLGLLATSAWRWLIVLDNADARALLDAGLVPTGANPNGRVLATTTDRLEPRIASQGRAIRAGLFTADEAEAYLRGPLPQAPTSETLALAATVGHHPLALSIAASTISANAMTVTDWIHEFTATDQMDAAADEPDLGGYPYLIGATWQVALGRASRGLPEGTAERAALVAAVQDPDGHPTWLWDSPAVADWVAGGAPLARRHGTPAVVQRLIDQGILELRGGTWRDGHVALHQLAARAIRESADPATLSDVAGILTEQWLLAITANQDAARPDVLHRNLRPITALPDLPARTETMATALLAFQQPSPATGHDRSWARFLEPYLTVGGATVRIQLADALLDLGNKEAAVGTTDRAQDVYREAADLYRHLVDDSSLTEGERASCLKNLGDIDERLGDPEQAHAHRQQAARLLERLTDPAVDDQTSINTRIRRLTNLITLHDHLDDPEGRVRAEARAIELLTDAPADPSDAADEDSWDLGSTWQALGALMHGAGRLEEAKDCLSRSVATYERSSDRWDVAFAWDEVMLSLALLHARTGEWNAAETRLTRITDPRQYPWSDSLEEYEVDDEGAWRFPTDEQRDALVLLASVQTHLGQRDDVDRHLTRAAEEYEEPASDGEGALSDPPSEDEREWYEDSLKHRADRDQAVVRFLLQRAALRACLSDRWGEARGLFGAALESAQEAAADAPGDTTVEAELGRLMAELAWASKRLGLHEEAENHYRNAASIYQTLTELDPSDARAHERLAGILHDQAKCLYLIGRLDAHAEVMARSVSTYRRAVELAPDDRSMAKNLAEALTMLAWAADREGDQTSAVAHREGAITILSALADQDPHDEPTQILLADALLELAGGLFVGGDLEAAESPFRRALDLLAPLAVTDDETRRKLAGAQLALSLALQGRPQEALAHATDSVASYRLLAERAPDDLEIQMNLALSLAILGARLGDLGQGAQAAEDLTSAVNILQLLFDLDPQERPEELIEVLDGLHELLRDLGRTDEADEALARATALQHRYPEDDEDE